MHKDLLYVVKKPGASTLTSGDLGDYTTTNYNMYSSYGYDAENERTYLEESMMNNTSGIKKMKLDIDKLKVGYTDSSSKKICFDKNMKKKLRKESENKDYGMENIIGQDIYDNSNNNSKNYEYGYINSYRQDRSQKNLSPVINIGPNKQVKHYHNQPHSTSKKNLARNTETKKNLPPQSTNKKQKSLRVFPHKRKTSYSQMAVEQN